jgi:hypothetical protein
LSVSLSVPSMQISMRIFDSIEIPTIGLCFVASERRF